MGKNKLERFEENLTFDCLIQPLSLDVLKGDHPMKGKWRKDFFKNENPMVIELGCGKGEYAIGQARLFLEKNFYKTMNQARISKLDIFDYPGIEKYEKILYVDADSLILKDPEAVFDSIQDDVVYVVGEGNVLNEGEYWGRSLFLKENPEYPDREGMSAFILGFKNIQPIKKLFIKIKQSFYLDMYQNKLRFYDQPFFNFYLLQNKMCNTETFKTLVRSRPTPESALKDGLIIVHFAGCPGHGNVKLELINEFKSGLLVATPTPTPVVESPVANETIFLLQQQLEEMRQKTAQLEELLRKQINH